ncbi:MAG: exodeoxyribonuclease V subunit gamma [Chitinophagaceae bacterium]|nr:exodeoxyribonuclease V subunit gamma [Chitinophagaceae bacterium]
MSILIKSSNSLHQLAEVLSETIPAHPQNIFQPVYIVSQTDGMNSWLKTQIAERTGIAANIEFLQPNELINKVYFLSGGKLEKTLDKHQLQWLIYEELGNPAFKDSFPQVAAYYSNPGTEGDIKRIALAQVVSDLFDQYQVYRYDMLEAWEKDTLVHNVQDEEWQKKLWSIIKERSGVLFPDKSRVKKTIIENLKQEGNIRALERQLPAVHFFGTSLITPYHYEILQAIAMYNIQVYVYLSNPAPDIYWYEDLSRKAAFYRRKKTGLPDQDTLNNPLLTDWGKLIQNTFLLFFTDEDTLNTYEDLITENENTTLLSAVQQTFRNNLPPASNQFTENQLKDGSIIIQSCFSELREVETLYNYLIKTLDENPGRYSLRDIVVQVTDINKYAAYIRAVFDNAPYRLRYNIADESIISSDSISSALYAILTIDESVFTSENVLQLLDFSAIRKRFKLTETELIRGVVADANIRHGIEGSEEDDSVFVSWGYGLKRIIYGLCMSGGEEVGTGETSFFPLDSTEGGTADEVIRFTGMVRLLIKSLQARECGKKITEWTGYVTDTINELLADIESENAEEYQLLIQQLKEIEVSGQFFEQEITYPVFLRQFLPVLESAERNADFGRGGITFCSLIPMRSIPFRIVAMLGLDFDKFPRKPVKTGFNLMEKFPQTGDRNVKINDKHLFLETLMSAGDKLYISYTGQNSKDNKNRPPSILTDELLSFIQSGTEIREVNKILTTLQPLHGFSNKYGNDPHYYNYLLTTVAPQEIGEEPEEIVPDETQEEMDIHTLYNFFSDTIQFYYQKTLGISYDDASVSLAETEMFEMNHLEKWQLTHQLLNTEPDQIATFMRAATKQGDLPLKAAGEYEVQVILENHQQTIAAFRQMKGNHSEEFKEFHVTIDGINLTAGIANIFANRVLVPNLSKNPAKAELRAWLYALLLKVAGAADLKVFLINQDVSEVVINDIQNAKEVLRQLIHFFKNNADHPVAYKVKWGSLSKSALKNNIQSDISNNDQYLALAIREGLIDITNIEATHNDYKVVAGYIKNQQNGVFVKQKDNEAE